MNRNFILAAIIAAFFLYGCKKESIEQPSPQTSSPDAPVAGAPGRSVKWLARYSGSNYSQAISIDSANRMIGSYLTSINYPGNDSDLRSLIFDADTLRAYLNDSRIVTLKFMIAHQPAYISGGKYGVYAGMKSSALTMVIVGLDQNDQYIYNNRNMVYEHVFPCPNTCPGAGTALLP